MSLKSLWLQRKMSRTVDEKRADALTSMQQHQPVEWEHNGETHIFAMKFPNDWDVWCHLRPGEAYNHKLPSRGWPAEEATVAPFRASYITCKACLLMWRLVKNRGPGNFLWEPK